MAHRVRRGERILIATSGGAIELIDRVPGQLFWRTCAVIAQRSQTNPKSSMKETSSCSDFVDHLSSFARPLPPDKQYNVTSELHFEHLLRLDRF